MSERLRCRYDGIRSKPQFLEYHRSRSTESEAIDADDLAVESHIFVPESGYAGFNCDPLAAIRRQHAFAILRGLLIKPVERRHRDNADSGAQSLRSCDRQLQLAAAGQQNVRQRSRFTNGDVSTFQYTRPPLLRIDLVKLRERLP